MACPGTAAGAIIINHLTTDLSKVPTYWINQAKTNLRVACQHTSHGSQLVMWSWCGQVSWATRKRTARSGFRFHPYHALLFISIGTSPSSERFFEPAKSFRKDLPAVIAGNSG
ncbi:MAG: hypothetical protein ACYDH3_08590 [Candidatus Aminicenantales bacterium]